MGPRSRDEERIDPLHKGEHDDDDDDSFHGERRGGIVVPPEDDHVITRPSLRATTAALCLGMLTHSYLLISVFPYSGFLAMHLLDLDETAASQYAGLIASSFMLGRALTSLAWGRAADAYGRTTLLYTSLALQGFFSVAFGLVRRSFVAALVIRFLLGCSNGVIALIKTIVSEISSKEDEAHLMSFVLGFWSIGFLFSPALAGFLADPVGQYPEVDWIQQLSVLHTLPFLLPNLFGAALCLIAVVSIKLFVRETLPGHQRRSIVADLQRWWQWRRQHQHQYRPVLKTHESDRDFGPEKEDEYSNNEKPVTSMASLMSRPETRKCLVVFWLYSFLGLTVDECFPLFCLSHEAGFGLPEKEIGRVLSLCGLIFALCQYGLYSAVYNRYGLYGSIKVSSALSTPILFFVPLSLVLNRGMEGELRWTTFFFLAGMLALHRCFSLVFFSSISVATNRTVPVCDRASMNGLSVLGGSVAKALGPTFAGLLTTGSVKWLGRYASLLVFGTISMIGLCVTLLAFVFLRDEEAAEPNVDKDEEREEEEEEIVQSIELLPRGHQKNKI